LNEKKTSDWFVSNLLEPTQNRLGDNELLRGIERLRWIGLPTGFVLCKVAISSMEKLGVLVRRSSWSCAGSVYLRLQRRGLCSCKIAESFVSWGVSSAGRSFSTDATSSSSGLSLFEEGVRAFEKGLKRKATKKFKAAAELQHAPALRALGRMFLKESLEDDKMAHLPDNNMLEQLVPALDCSGQPTGGARSPEETKLQIIRIRNKNKKKSRPDALLDKRAEGFMWLQKAATELNDTDAMVMLGNAFFENEKHREFMEKKLGISAKNAIEFWQKASESDPPHVDALYNLGCFYYDGLDGVLERNGKLALRFIELAAELGDRSAMFWLGQYYLGGDESIDPDFTGDPDKGWEFIEKACEEGHSKAQIYAALFLKDKDGMQDAAKLFLSMAIDLKDPEAVYMAGSFCLEAEPNFFHAGGIDYPKAFDYFQRAAMEGHPEAALNLGVFHYEGLGTVKDHFEAYRAYEYAASLGSLQAYRNIAAMYHFGEGPLEKDPGAAKAILDAVNRIESSKSSS